MVKQIFRKSIQFKEIVESNQIIKDNKQVKESRFTATTVSSCMFKKFINSLKIKVWHATIEQNLL